jgi:hypothetical protein
LQNGPAPGGKRVVSGDLGMERFLIFRRRKRRLVVFLDLDVRLDVFLGYAHVSWLAGAATDAPPRTGERRIGTRRKGGCRQR